MTCKCKHVVIQHFAFLQQTKKAETNIVAKNEASNNQATLWDLGLPPGQQWWSCGYHKQKAVGTIQATCSLFHENLVL